MYTNELFCKKNLQIWFQDKIVLGGRNIANTIHSFSADLTTCLLFTCGVGPTLCKYDFHNLQDFLFLSIWLFFFSHTKLYVVHYRYMYTASEHACICEMCSWGLFVALCSVIIKEIVDFVMLYCLIKKIIFVMLPKTYFAPQVLQ